MTKIKYYSLAVLFLILTVITACKKDWLNVKPNKSLVIPTTAADFQALLDNITSVFNINQPSLSLVSDCDFYVADARYPGLSQTERSAYVWAATSDNFYSATTVDDWTLSYQRILNANVALTGLQSISVNPGEGSAYNNVKGSALFYRSYDYYNMAQLFCKPYVSSSANSDLGLPLRTSPNINITLGRSSVQQTYNQIINDLVTAAPLLTSTPLFPTRPSKQAVFGLLARVYLSQRNYAKAYVYADSCLRLQSDLIDYNQLNTADSYPVPHFNKEVIFNSTLITYLSFLPSRMIVDSTLYKSYASNDLRANIYFTILRGNPSYKGSYDGSFNFFGGLATDEIYLIRAECAARAGDATSATNDFNTLMKNRFITGTYIPLTGLTPENVLSIILAERRKELCFRALRWTDLRRLNTETRFQTNLLRIISGTNYTLLPNSTRYVLPLDNNEISVGGLPQNPR
ncbi:MAG: hypothetical protein JWQ19_3977 [Subtercola sp.]|nr:hypothetical protein [Subtercola sp.]